MRGVYLGKGKIRGLDGKPYLIHIGEAEEYRIGAYVDFDPSGVTRWVAKNLRAPEPINKDREGRND